MSCLGAQETILSLDPVSQQKCHSHLGRQLCPAEQSNQPPSSTSIFIGSVPLLTCSLCGMSAWEPELMVPRSVLQELAHSHLPLFQVTWALGGINSCCHCSPREAWKRARSKGSGTFQSQSCSWECLKVIRVAIIRPLAKCRWRMKWFWNYFPEKAKSVLV